MMLHDQASVRQPAHAHSANMQVGALRRGEAGRDALVGCAAQDRLDRQHAVAQDFFFSVDVAEKHFEGTEPLGDAPLERLPLLRGENLRQQIAKPGPAPPRTLAGDVEGHPHFPHGGFQSLVQGPDLRAGQGIEALEERPIDRPDLPGRVLRLAPMRK